MIVEYNRFYSSLPDAPAVYAKTGPSIQSPGVIPGRNSPISVSRSVPETIWRTGPESDEMIIEMFPLFVPEPTPF
jgi:hypothetical protein